VISTKDAGGSRTHFDRVAAGCLTVRHQRRENQRTENGGQRTEKTNPTKSDFYSPSSVLSPRSHCPRQDSNLDFDLRTVVCQSVTLRGRIGVRGELNPPLRRSQRRVPADYTTDTMPRPGFEPGTPRSKRGMMIRFTTRAGIVRSGQ
jgi:hypothetical protein